RRRAYDCSAFQPLGRKARSERERLGEVRRDNLLGPLQVGDGPSDAQGAMERSDGEAETLDRGGGDALDGRLEAVEALEVRRREVGVAEAGARGETGRRPLPRREDATPDRLGRFLRGRLLDLRPGDRGNGDVEVDPVEQRSRELSRVAGPFGVAAGADAPQVAQKGAGAGVPRVDGE